MEEEKKQQSQQSNYFDIENDLKQLFFAIIDIHDELKDKLQAQTAKEDIKRNKQLERQYAREIILIERFYDIVSDFARIWGAVDKENPVIPPGILAGVEMTCEYLGKPVVEKLKLKFDPEEKQKLNEKYKIKEQITENEIDEYFKQFEKSGANERLSDIDREENWENLSNVSDDDVLYLKGNQADQFEIEGDDMDFQDPDEIQPPQDDDENDEEFKAGEQEEEEEESQDSANKDQEDDSAYKLHQHKSFVTRLALHPSKKILVSGGGDDVALAWDLENKDLLEIVAQKKETVDNVAFNFDGTLIATGTLDGQLDIYSYVENKFEHKCKLEGLEGEITFIDWHKKGNAIVAGGFDNTAHMWNGQKGTQINSFYGHEDVINHGCFAPDGKTILTLSADKSVRVWNPQTGQETQKIFGYGFHEDSINVIAFQEKNPALIATGGEDRVVCISNYQTGKILGRTPEHEGIIDAVIFSSNQEWFITGSGVGELRIYELANTRLRQQIRLQGAISKIIEIPKTYNIIVTTNQGRLYKLDYRKPQELQVLKGHGSAIHDIQLDGDKGAFCAQEDGAIRYFDFSKFTVQ